MKKRKSVSYRSFGAVEDGFYQDMKKYLVEPVLQGHEKADVSFVPVLRRRGSLTSAEAWNGRVALDPRFLANLLQLVRREVGSEPGVVDAVQLVRVELRRRVVAKADTVLVQDLDDGNGRLVAVFGLGVGVEVRQQVVGVL